MSYVPSSRRRHTLSTLKSSTALFSSMLIAASGLTGNASVSAEELPQGGSVAAGNVTISQTAPNAMVINQTSKTAVTNWQSFSIGQGNSVSVVQPSASSAMLARVNGSTTSTIAGSLSATGQFVLVNPNGISIAATGTVNAGGGFVATTLGISDDDFVSGKRIFKGNGASGAVSNDGAITVGSGGYAALIGGTVSNSGTISVPMGKVGLGSGEIATLDFSGDGFLQVGVPTASPGKGALVSNAGKITANGGSVHIKAAQARDAARQAINMSGVIEARSVSGSNGDITLGGSDGDVAVSGKLDVSSASGKGGTVRVTGRQIKLSGATIDASGKTGGGTVRIGGDRHGAGTPPRAAKVAVDKTTIIRADATDRGNGGDVVIWSDSRTDFAGTIGARGGVNGGDGGEAEVSSKGVLGYSGLTVLTAAKGATGTLLLDPYNVVISSAADTSGFTAGADDSIINVSTLQTALAGANVTISTGSSGAQAGDITIAAPLIWSANLLKLDAAHSIKVASTVTVGGTGALMLNTNVGGGSGGTLDFGLSSTGFGGRIDFTGTPGQQALFIDMAQYSLAYSAADLLDINNANNGRFALAGNLDLASMPYTDAPITSFSGTFEGLGHTISNLTITSATNNAAVGLFGTVTGGSVRDIGLIGGSVSGTDTQPTYPNPAGSVGALVGLLTTSSNGTLASVLNAYASTNVSGGTSANVGGLIGNAATHGATTLVANSHATGTVTGGQSAIVGGLVGNNVANASAATISDSFATGAVRVGDFGNAGGLVGYNYGFSDNATITDSHATGVVTGGANATLGGLAGQNSSRLGTTASITNAYATGTVGSAGLSAAGGLVGVNSTSGGYSSLANVFATGAVFGGSMNGGLAGQSVATSTGSVAVATITNAYATGAVSGIQYGQAGGLVGILQAYGSNGAASVTNAYAIGVATAPTQYFQTYAGGLIGWTNPQNSGTVSVGNAYWDTASSGLSVGIGHDGSSQQGNVTGLATASFQTAAMVTSLGAAFAGGQGLYPYLSAIFQNGVQAVSGTVYSDVGTTPLASGANGAVMVSVIGTNTLLGSATTGANGSYYVFGAAGTIANGAQLIAYTTQNGTPGVANAGRITTSAYAGSAPSQTGVDIYEPVKLTMATTGAATLSASGYDLSATPVVSMGSSLPAFLNGSAPTLVSTNSAGFTIDRTLDLTTPFAVQTVAGASLTVANAITLESGSALGLFASGALTINAPITVKGAGEVSLAYDTSSPAKFSFGLTGTGFTGSLTYLAADGTAAISDQGGALTVNSDAYTLLYSMADLVNINRLGLSGKYALAASLDAGGTSYTGALIGTGVDSNSIFRGKFEGLGHTIGNLTIAATGDSVGLFGFAYGSIQNIGLVGGSFAGAQRVGSLVGEIDYGTIANVYSTASVRGSSYVGGLIGLAEEHPTITNVYATGTVRGDNQYAGGLVGFLYNYSSLSNAYATGAVAGIDYVGGLAGANLNLSHMTNVYATGAVAGSAYVGGLSGWIGDSDVTNAYATGAVSGGSYVGGLAGGDGNGRTVSNASWDIATTGQTSAFGYWDGGSPVVNTAGQTTAQFQSAAAANNLGGAFAGGAGLYPYLTSFFPNGVQAISGIAYKDNGTTALASGANGAVTMNAFVNGTYLGSATTGANGYYYIFGMAGSIASGNSIVAYTAANATTGAANSATLGTATNAANQAGIDLFGNVLASMTSATALSAEPTLGTAKASAVSAAGGDTAATTAISAVGGQGFITSGAGFIIDRAVDTANPFFVRTTASDARITVARAITVGTGGSLGLYAAGALSVNAPITVKGAGSVSLAFDQNATTPSASDLSFALGAPLSFVDASGNALTSVPGNQSLTVNEAAYTLLYSMADVEVINSGLTGNYALARDLDASGRTYTTGVIAGGDSSFNVPATAFSGTFEGLGHTVSNLTISGGANNYVGLFGATGGTIRNIGIVGGSFSGNNRLGALAGSNSGTISNAYAASVVSGGVNVGGLVGDNSGSIQNVFTTGVVKGFNSVGGLVGANVGTIANAFATGAVNGTRAVGGLLGSSDGGSISNAYATGAVTASRAAGGLVGQVSSGTISNAYWDVSTSGTTVALGEDSTSQSGNVTGLTTAQLQTASAATDLGTAFAGDYGLYPYLVNFFPNGVQVIAGVAYTDAGQTVLASSSNGAGLVNVRVGNGAVQTVSTGANGYYYAFMPYGSIDTTNGSNVLAYTVADANTGAKDAAAFQTAVTGSMLSFGLSGGWRRDTTALANLSILDAAYSAATAGTSAAGLALESRSIFTVGNFTLDRVLSLAGTLSLMSPGTVTQTAAFSAANLILQGNGNTFTLTNSGNRFDQFVASGGAMSIYDARSLTIAANAVDACNCTISGVTGDAISIATAGDLTIASGAAVTGHSPVLAAGGAFINNAGSSAVTANSGRWLVYAAGPNGNTFGGLDSHNTAVWGTSYPDAVAASGNRYVFATRATLTVTALDAEMSFGETLNFNGYSVSGFQSGVAGAFLGDAPAGLTGLPSLSSAGAAANAASGTYDIAIARGSLAWSGYGYGFNFVQGKLTVTGSSQSRSPFQAPPVTFAPGPADIRPDGFGFSQPGVGAGATDPANPLNFIPAGFEKAIVCFPGRACE